MFVNYRSDVEGARAVVEQIVAAGGAAEAVQADVAVRAEVEAMYAAIEAAHGFVRCLVNNAGVTRDGLLMLMGDADWDAVLDASLRGTFLCSRAALRGMMHLGGGAITNIVSPSGIRGQAGQCNYSAAKGGVIAFTRALAREMGRHGVRVNAVCPGLIPTRMSESFIAGAGKALLPADPPRPARHAGRRGAARSLPGLGGRLVHLGPGDRGRRRPGLGANGVSSTARGQ